MKLKSILCLVIFLSFNVNAQEDTTLDKQNRDDNEIPATFVKNDKAAYDHLYHIRKGIDYPIVLGLGGTSIYLLTIVYSKKPTPVEDILKLNKNDLPSYDRWNAGYHDANLDQISYYPFYAVMPLPLLFLADKTMKNDRGQIGVM
jgi:hypothetical protein